MRLNEETKVHSKDNILHYMEIGYSPNNKHTKDIQAIL